MRFRSLGSIYLLLLILVICRAASAQPFTELTGSSLSGVYLSSVAWGDYDNDGDLDILITGRTSSTYISKIYRNNGNDTFTEQTGLALTGVCYSSVAWGDYDNDGDLDILLTGLSSSGPVSKIYRNNGNNTFTEQTGIALSGVSYSSVAWGDYDNDGYLDILLTGQTESIFISKIYRNNANNTFTEQSEIALTGVGYSSVAWGDYDNDGDLDILLTGLSGSPVSKIYRNNGNNTFTEQNGIALTGVSYSSVAWGDYDNDGDLDILLSGYTRSTYISKIYRNIGNNTFTEQTEIALTGVGHSSVAWGDYDNDGDLDILLTGYTGSIYISKIYRNNGNNTFTEQNGIALIGVGDSSVTLGDYDNDGDLDIHLSGYTSSTYISKIYRNNTPIVNSPPVAPINLNSTFNGNQFMLTWDAATDAQTLQPGLNYNIRVGSTDGSTNALSPMADISNGWRLLPKMGNTGSRNSYLLNPHNLKVGQIYYWSAQAIDTSLAGSEFAATASFMVSIYPPQGPITASDGTYGDKIRIDWEIVPGDVTAYEVWRSTINDSTTAQHISLGNDPIRSPYFDSSANLSTTYYYWLKTKNKTSISIFSQSDSGYSNTFTDMTSIALTGVRNSSVAWGDYDNDGDLDILITGYTGSTSISKIYRNNGNNSFTEQTGIVLTAVNNSSVAWGDYDNDGDLDILLTGGSGGNEVSKIYRNNGDNSFTEQSEIVLTGVVGSSAAWGDYDNDGDLDILLSGFAAESHRVSKIYSNNGDNSFTEQTGIALAQVSSSSAAWGDYDNDGDLDILLSGETNGSCTTSIYSNSGDNSFILSNAVASVYNSSVAWGDYDNDGDLDILLSGFTGSTEITKIYSNNGNRTFAQQTSNTLTGVKFSSVAWGDYDNDGDLDILLTGYNYDNAYVSKIYRNDGNNSFREMTEITLAGVGMSSVAWGDYDNDGDLDILLTGYTGVECISKIYRNETKTINSPPLVPTNLTATVTGDKYILSWDRTTDGQTPQYGLNYNVRVGSSLNGQDIISPMSDLNNGRHQLPKAGNAGTLNSYSLALRSLVVGQNYYWSVQAMDTSMVGSAFAISSSFNAQIYPPQVGIAASDGTYSERVRLSWTRVPGNVTAYEVWRNTVNDSTTAEYISEGNDPIDPSYDDTTGIQGTLYYYWLKSKNTEGTSTFSRSDSGYTTVLSELIGNVLSSVRESSVAWGDYDNDGDLDILLTGMTGSTPISKIYRNNGDNTFTEQTGIALTGVYLSSVAWGDYDNDGYLDILLTGNTGSLPMQISKIYRNNGDNSFTEQTGIALTGVDNSSVAWGDYDNDGYLDILLTGNYYYDSPVSKIYHNNGNNSFSYQSTIVLKDVYRSSVAWGDYDNDGDLDILLTGNVNNYYEVSKVYRNNGDNTFTDQSVLGVLNVSDSSVAWGDYDNDGYLDILLTGGNNDNGFSKVYRNNGNNSFIEQTGIALTGVLHSSVAWGDYDNDGDLDILLTGYTGTWAVSKIYRNDGNNTFTEQTLLSVPGVPSLQGVSRSSVAWGDYDSDGDLDILLTGSGSVSKIYRNEIRTINTPPSTPTNLNASMAGNKMILSWNRSNDSQTAEASLNYNIVMGDSPNKVNTLSPMADVNSGLRRIPSPGNSGMVNTRTLNIDTREVGKRYYWSVQAIDTTFAASSFATRATFVVPVYAPEGMDASDGTYNDKVRISWSNIPGDVTAYEVWRNTVADTATAQYISAENDPTSSPYDDMEADPGIVYYYWIKSKNSVETSTFSKFDQGFASQFSEQTGFTLTGVKNSSVAWGDYDNDGNLDILLTGFTNNTYIAKIYRNNGNNSFTEQVGIPLTGVGYSSVAWGDYDNDGDLDILITGYTGSSSISKIYRNNGNNSFTEQTKISLTGVRDSSVSWGDYDNDGYLDILLTGYTGSVSVSKIYRNNGNNSFTEQTGIVLMAVRNSCAMWGDYNGDGYLDILLTGYSNNNIYISKIYRNNGNNSFTDQTGIVLTGVGYSSVAWGDYDNDGDLDLLLTGYTGSTYVSKIYRNNGNNIFTEQTAIALKGVRDSSVAWGDYDNDGDLDIFLTGYTGSNTAVSKIYINNGNNSFKENTLIALTGVSNSAVGWGDYDNDGDLDILLTGYTGSAVISIIYKNCTQTANPSPIAPVNLNTSLADKEIVFSWDYTNDDQTPQAGLNYNIHVGNDIYGTNNLSPMSDPVTGWRRLPRIGNAGSRNSFTLIPHNMVVGQLYYWSVQAIDTSFSGSAFAEMASFAVAIYPPEGAISASDGTYGDRVRLSWTNVPGDVTSYEVWRNTIDDSTTAQHVSLGHDPISSPYDDTSVVQDITYYYWLKAKNTTKVSSFSQADTGHAGSFTEQAGITLYGVTFTNDAWGDYDNDGDLDILITGYSTNHVSIAKIYRNNGNNTFTEQTGITLTGVQYSSVVWGDYDNDGDLDILLTGYSSNKGPISKIYRNNGNNTFTEQTGITLTGVQYSSVAWGDYDNDGDLDILLTGFTGNADVSKIYRNNGNNTFSEQTGIVLTGVQYSNVAWGDYNNDSYLDILLTGYTGNSIISKIYRNNGNNSFTEQTNIVLPGIIGASSSVAWGDYNNDGYLDILLIGDNNISPSFCVSKIYQNNGDNTFTDQTNIVLTELMHTSVAWGDYDNDGFLDILLTGRTSNLVGGISQIYHNDGNTTFTKRFGFATGVSDSCVVWGDYDNDGDLDILISGNTGSSYVSKIYRNESIIANTPPNAPTNLSSSIAANKMVLSWDRASDAQTPESGLNYNIRLGSSPGGLNRLSPMANGATGWRLLPKPGNTGSSNSWSLDTSALTIGTRYYWSVQAIDTAFAGGAWAPESSFIVQPSNPDADQDGVDYLTELFMGTDPGSGNAQEPVIEAALTDGKWVYTFQQAHDTHGVSATVLWSTDLQTWQDTDITLVQGADLGSAWEMKAYLLDAGYDTVFFRLLIKD